jgi:hypothetical protein
MGIRFPVVLRLRGLRAQRRARPTLGNRANTCSGVPTLFYPDSCNESANGPTSFGDNLIPGPPLY